MAVSVFHEGDFEEQLGALSDQIGNMGDVVLLATQTTAEAGGSSYTNLSQSVRNFRYLALSGNDSVIAIGLVDLFVKGIGFEGTYVNKNGDRIGGFATYHTDTQARIYGYVSGSYTFSDMKLYGIK